MRKEFTFQLLLVIFASIDVSESSSHITLPPAPQLGVAQCVDAGLTGCCTGAGAGGISCGPYTNSTGGNCYCDASCHTYDDCCDNIEYTCPTPTAIFESSFNTLSPVIVAQCVDAGLTGCCTNSSNVSCGPYTNAAGGICFCDPECFNFFDCCDNIEITCNPTNGSITVSVEPAPPFPAASEVTVTCSAESTTGSATLHYKWLQFCSYDETLLVNSYYYTGTSSTVTMLTNVPYCADIVRCVALTGNIFNTFDFHIQITGTGLNAGLQSIPGNAAVLTTNFTSGYILCGTGVVGANTGTWCDPEGIELTPTSSPVSRVVNSNNATAGYTSLVGVAVTPGVYTCEMPNAESGGLDYHTVALYPSNFFPVGATLTGEIKFSSASLVEVDVTSSVAPPTTATWYGPTGEVLVENSSTVFQINSDIMDLTNVSYVNKLVMVPVLPGVYRLEVGTEYYTADIANQTIIAPASSFNFIIYSVGSDFSVTCEQLGDGSTETQWLLDGDLLSQGFPATLNFSSFSDTLHSKSYTCRNQFGDGIDVTYLTIVIVPDDAISIAISQDSEPIAGLQHRLYCNATKTYAELSEDPMFTWYKDGAVVSGGDGISLVTTVSGTTETQTLTFDALRTSHTGDYTCEVSLSSPALNNSLTVDGIITVPVPKTCKCGGESSAETNDYLNLCSSLSCNCSTDGNCECLPPLVGSGDLCTLDSDGDGYPDHPLAGCTDNEAAYCHQDNCPDYYNPDQNILGLNDLLPHEEVLPSVVIVTSGTDTNVLLANGIALNPNYNTTGEYEGGLVLHCLSSTEQEGEEGEEVVWMALGIPQLPQYLEASVEEEGVSVMSCLHHSQLTLLGGLKSLENGTLVCVGKDSGSTSALYVSSTICISQSTTESYSDQLDADLFTTCPEEVVIEMLQMKADEIFSPNSSLTVEEMQEAVSNLTHELASATAPKPDQAPLDSQDLMTVNSITEDVLDFLDETLTANVSTPLNEDVADVLNNLLDVSYYPNWQEINDKAEAGVLETVANTEQYAGYISQALVSDSVETGQNTRNITVSRKNLVLSAEVVDEDSLKDVIFPKPQDLVNTTFEQTVGVGDAMIRIPAQHLQERMDTKKRQGPVKLSVVNVMLRASESIPVRNGTLPVTPLLSSQVFPLTKEDFTTPAELTFTNVPVGQQDTFVTENPRCAFWNFSDPVGNGNWSIAGLQSEETAQTSNGLYRLVCKAYHLTSFAVLVDIKDSEPEFEMVIFTIIGCGISIACLVLTIILLLLLGKELFDSVHYFVHLNLAIALLLGYTVFLATGIIDSIDFRNSPGIVNITDNEVACKFVVPLLLYYLFTAAFSWMLCEGVMLFLMLVVVFSSLSKKWWPFFIFGWGFPLIPLAATLGALIAYEDLQPMNYCWLPAGRGMEWAFLVPMIVMISVNIVFLILAVHSMLRVKRRLEPSMLSTAKNIALATVVLLPLMGGTWLVGLFSIIPNDLVNQVFGYIFIILNTLQGVFIFFFHVVRNKALWNKLCKKKKKSPVYSTGESTNKGTKQTTITSAAPETARKKTLSFTNKEMKVFKKYPEGKKKDQDNSLLQFGDEEFKSFASKTVQSSVVTKSPSRKPRKKNALQLPAFHNPGYHDDTPNTNTPD